MFHSHEQNRTGPKFPDRDIAAKLNDGMQDTAFVMDREQPHGINATAAVNHEARSSALFIPFQKQRRFQQPPAYPCPAAPDLLLGPFGPMLGPCIDQTEFMAENSISSLLPRHRSDMDSAAWTHGSLRA